MKNMSGDTETSSWSTEKYKNLIQLKNIIILIELKNYSTSTNNFKERIERI